MCPLLHSVCPTLSQDSAPNIHLFRLSLLLQSIWHHSSVSKCLALLATQQIAALNHCPHSLFPMADSMDKTMLDGTNNLPHVSPCHQHCYRDLKMDQFFLLDSFQHNSRVYRNQMLLTQQFPHLKCDCKYRSMSFR